VSEVNTSPLRVQVELPWCYLELLLKTPETSDIFGYVVETL
jgi:hypothetical protein